MIIYILAQLNLYWLFFCQKYLIFLIGEEVVQMTQEELRKRYNKCLEREKQTYISKVTGIDNALLSKFKNNKIDLYPNLFSKLEKYLLNS